MNKTELLQKLHDIEWDDFEVKEARRELPKNIWESVSAFANSSGGWIVLGVAQHNKNFEITGTENAEKIEQDFVTVLRSKNKFNIIISPLCKKYKIEKKVALAFYIPSAEIKPVYFNSLQNTFIRTASGDQRASEQEINALYRDQSFGTMSGKAAPDTSIKSLNRRSFKSFREYLKRIFPELKYNSLADRDFCQKLQITKGEKLTYGGLLFLGKNEDIQDKFPDFRIDYLEIPGTDYAKAEPRYTFRMQEHENLWEYYFVLFQRLQIYADNPLHIGNMGIGKEDNKQAEALREGLVNLLIHSDYFSPMKPRIRVFTNRIEFENPGSLPRNPVLAKLFRCAKLCESAGYGIDKMLYWKEFSSGKVFFETSVDKTKITFTLNQKLNQKLPETTRNYQKLPETTRKNKKERTSEIENKIIEILKSDGSISRANIAKKIDISNDLAKYYIDKLKKSNRINREGADRGGTWVVLE